MNYSLDGGSNTNGLRNTGNVAPNPDAVQEFRVVTNSYSAEYGRFAGGVVNMVTKSGTNQLHGSLFEFLRNDKLNANRWLPGQTVPCRRIRCTATSSAAAVGGPIIKNRTFFFGSYSGLRERTSIFNNTATPLNAIERGGDLSRQRRHRARGSAQPASPSPAASFPVTRIDPVAKKIIDTYLPLPNLPGRTARSKSQIPHPTRHRRADCSRSITTSTTRTG